tara:strand:- start:31200 stop:32969 length:1770 start_codon:yes stop_codon:yes gene_type:complete
MSLHREPFRFPRIGTGLRAALRDGYHLADLRKDVLAGLTIGTVAVPLSMALAIATGVPPQNGLYTAIVAGAIIALTGGSRFNVSGPTAAFVVILFPVVQKFGLGGLLIATMMAGLILVALGISRMGRLIQFVPYPVVLGFTAGIAVVIAVMQIPDFLGLQAGDSGEHFVDNVIRIAQSFDTLQPWEMAVGLFTLAVMLVWPRMHTPVPAPLTGLIVGALAAYLVNRYVAGGSVTGGPLVETIATRFSWEFQGASGVGIPPMAPTFMLPWTLPGANGLPLEVNFSLIRDLLGPAFAIAVLGAIESLLCAVVSDGLTRTRHDPDAELIGQGLGNVLAPMFGGITATAAIARTATSIRSGARSPIAAIVHSMVVLLAVVAFAGLLGMVPMAALAALLIIIAWNMSEFRHFRHVLRTAPGGDVLVLLTCFGLTVLFDMVLAVGVGVGLAAVLFIRQMAETTHTSRLDAGQAISGEGWPAEVAVYDVNGPLFFAVADKAVTSILTVDPAVKIVVVDFHDVPSIDASAINALYAVIEEMRRRGIALVLAGLPARKIVKLRRAGIRKVQGQLTYCTGLPHARRVAERWLADLKSGL